MILRSYYYYFGNINNINDHDLDILLDEKPNENFSIYDAAYKTPCGINILKK